MTFICPKCKKEYVSDSHYYKKHIATCQGKVEKKPIKKLKKKQKKDEITLLKKNMQNLEKRVSRLENLLTRESSDVYLEAELRITPKFTTMDEFHRELMKIIQNNPKFKHIKRNYVLKDLRKLFLKDYKISEKEFEDNILRLYRKQIIDLQPGGNNSEYQISLPTGKKFYYLITKT